MFQGHYAQIIKLHSPRQSEKATVFIAVRFDNPVRLLRVPRCDLSRRIFNPNYVTIIEVIDCECR